MELDDLYRDLGRWIDARDEIRKEITALQTKQGMNTCRCADRIRALEDQYDGIQQRIIEFDRRIRFLEDRRGKLV